MAKRKFFNSKESYELEKAKSRKHRYVNYHTKRTAILEELKPEIERISAASKISESLAALVDYSSNHSQKQAEETLGSKLAEQLPERLFTKRQLNREEND